jgi:hypothetical protein
LTEEGGTDAPWVLRLENRDSGTTPQKFIFNKERRDLANPAVRQTGAIQSAVFSHDNSEAGLSAVQAPEDGGGLLRGS